MLYLVYLSVCLCLCLLSYFCKRFFIIILIFITIIIGPQNLIKTEKLVFFGHFCQTSSLGMLLSFCFFFFKFLPGAAYKVLLIKRRVHLVFRNSLENKSSPKELKKAIIILFHKKGD